MSLVISLNNNTAQVYWQPSEQKQVIEIKNAMKVRHPNAFFIRKYMQPGWDGYINFMTDAGVVKSGLFPMLIRLLEERGFKYSVVDEREYAIKPKLVTKFGNIELRDYQAESVQSVIENKVAGLIFPIAMLKAATNAGKTLISAALYYAFQKQPTILFINGTDMYEQARDEFPLLIPKDELGWFDPKQQDWKQFTVCKIGTIASRLNQIKPKLATMRVALVDECDLADNKTYKKPLQYLFNCYARVGMSGTAQVGKLAKFKPTHMAVQGMFGDITHEITNRELIDKGHSSEVVVGIIKGNTKVNIPNDFAEEYDKGVVLSVERNKQVVERLAYHMTKGHLPALVIVKRRKHVKILTRRIQKAFDLRIQGITGQDKNRKQVIQDFRDGKIDILISSMIIRRGMNLKVMRYMLNAGGGDDPANPLQLLGRQMRKLEGIKHKYFEDFYDEGSYLRRHSKHRINYYKAEKLQVKELFKK